ncbi:F-box only protein 13-like [Lolium rigidum]|uniref:F-box only protein 13-like n=1 Tax=Lolium rigidum TaxID=89674 RepID=UPI001F5D6698|nr:F-box only protein 13-like [Lolium rigidum]
MAASMVTSGGGSKKRKHEQSTPELGHLHEDMLERVLARLPPASFFRLRGVCRRWRDAAGSPAFLAACASVPARDPWFLMLSERQDERRPPIAFDAAERTWARCRGAPGPGPVPVAAAGGLVLYRAADTGALTVANPLTGASRALPPPPPATLQAVAMYGSPYRVVLILGKLTDLSMSTFDPSTNTWSFPVPLSRKPDPNASPATTDAPTPRGNNNEDDDEDADADDDGTVFFLTKSGTVISSTTERSPSREHSSAVTCGPNGSNPVAYFLSGSGAVVSCDLASRLFSELPRVLPVPSEHSIDVAACGGRAYAVVLTEYLDTASLRVWEFLEGAWAQAAAMPPAMSHGFFGAKADVNCVGHGRRIMVCVSSSGEANGSFLCDVANNRWEELPRCADGGDGAAADFVASFSFEPRMEVAV